MVVEFVIGEVVGDVVEEEVQELEIAEFWEKC